MTPRWPAPSPRPAASSIAARSAPLFAAKLVGNGGMFVAVLLIARALLPAGRGTVAFVTVTAIVTARVCALGVTEATTVFAAARPGDRPALLANAIAFAGTAALAGGALLAAALRAGPHPAGVRTPELAVLVTGAVAVALVDEGAAFLQGAGRFGAWALITGVMPWLYAALVAALRLLADLTVLHALLAWLTAQAACALALLAAGRHSCGMGRPRIGLLREALAFGVRAWVGSLSTFLNFRSDQILLGLMASEAALGVYAVAVNASEVLLYLPTVIALALVPEIASTEARARVDRTLHVFRLLAVVTLAGTALAAAAGPWLVPLVFGAAYEGAVVPFVWLLPGGLGFATSVVFSGALLGSSRPGLSSAGPFVSLVLGLALDVLLIPRLGATGAAIGASAAFVAGGATALVAFRAHTGFASRLLVPTRLDLDAVVRRMRVSARRSSVGA